MANLSEQDAADGQFHPVRPYAITMDGDIYHETRPSWTILLRDCELAVGILGHHVSIQASASVGRYLLRSADIGSCFWGEAWTID